MRDVDTSWLKLIGDLLKYLWKQLVTWFVSIPPGPEPLPAPEPQEPEPQQPEPDRPIIILPEDPNQPSEKPGKFPHLARALEITGKFEGKGFDEVTDDFDGQGISVGILQWNYGQGSLQTEILQPFVRKYGPIDAIGVFPSPGIDATVNMTNSRALQYCRTHMLIGKRVKSDWFAAWSKFMKHPYVVEIQMAAAAKIADRADQLMRRWGFNSQRSFCFFFDVVTQNGSMKTVTPTAPNRELCLRYAREATDANRLMWTKMLEKTLPVESMMLFQAAYERAVLARPAYFQDVFARKGTIALGCGIVHGDPWDLFPPET